MMKEIYENGSIESSIPVYEDFFDYNSGIYQHITGSNMGSLSVKIIGWGITENGTKYSILTNSWVLTGEKKDFSELLEDIIIVASKTLLIQVYQNNNYNKGQKYSNL